MSQERSGHLNTVDARWDRIYFDLDSHPFYSFVLKKPDVDVLKGVLEFFLYLPLLIVCLFFKLLSSFIERESSIGSMVSSIPPISYIFFEMFPENLSANSFETLDEAMGWRNVSCVFKNASCSLSTTGLSTKYVLFVTKALLLAKKSRWQLDEANFFLAYSILFCFDYYSTFSVWSSICIYDWASLLKSIGTFLHIQEWCAALNQ